MMQKVYRFIEYREAIWFAEGNILEDALKKALVALPTSRQRVVDRTDGTSDMGATLREFPGEGIALHCTRYVEGQPTGVVSMIDAPSSAIASRNPGNQENFLNRDFIAFISGDCVLTFNSAQGGASIRSYVHGLFRLANLHEDTSKFGLARRAAVDQISRIEAAGGVEKVRLDLTIEEAAALAVQDIQKPHKQWTMRDIVTPVAKMVQALCLNGSKASGLADSKKGKLQLSIAVPKGDLVAAKDGLDGLGEILIDDDDADNYVLILRNGDQIKPSEMAVKKRIRVDRLANTVDTEQVFTEMRQFMRELRETGQLG